MLRASVMAMVMLAGAGAAWAGTVGVTVTAPDGPVAGASVTVAGATSSTNGDGIAVFEEVAGGLQPVIVTATCRSRAGATTLLRRKTAQVKVLADGSVEITVALPRCPPEPAPKQEDDRE